MDSISDSDSEDAGSIPAGATKNRVRVSARANRFILSFFFAHTLTPTLNWCSLAETNPVDPVMFDFEKLDVYKKAKIFNSGIREFMKNTRLDSTTRDQLRRAAFSIVLNLAEGSGRFTQPDRRNFYIVARSSIFECVAILDVLKDELVIDENSFREFYNRAEELSKIIFAMIKNLQ